MLIIMGTSLKVHGFKKLVKEFAKVVHDSSSSNSSSSTSTPAASSSSLPPTGKSPNNKTTRNWAGKVVFVNKTAPGSEWDGVIDYHVQGESDTWVEKVLEDWKKMRPADWEVQKTLDESGSLKVMKEVTNATAAKKAKGGGKKKKGVENKNVDAVPRPSSPNKRRNSESHYSDVESSPSKKKKPLSRVEGLDFEGRGMLFGDSTNLSAAKDVSGEEEDVFVEAALKEKLEKEKSRVAKTLKGQRSRKNLKLEVVLDERSTSTKAAPVEKIAPRPTRARRTVLTA